MAAMKALLRSLLLWFLLAGVPFQGFAAATMLFCAPLPAPPAHVAMDMSQPHDHAAMLAAQAVGDLAHQGHDGSHHGDASTGHAKCASAAACCTGAPLAPSLSAAMPPADACFATVPFESAAPAAVDLAGPERPPKFLLA